MLNGLRILTITSLVLAAPGAAQAAQLGDPVRLPVSASFSQTLSGRGTNTALAGGDGVSYQDVRGRWHRFTFDTEPEQVRLARTLGGGGLAIWDSGTSILVREWHRDGRLDAARTVISGINTVSSDDTNDLREVAWDASADRRGTVAIAALADDAHGRAVYATVRDPDGRWWPQTAILPPDPAADYPQDSWKVGVARVSPISVDGTFSVSWSRWLLYPPVAAPYEAGFATRSGRAKRFGTISAPLPAATVNPSLLAVDGSRTVRVAPDVGAFCGKDPLGCEAQWFTWSNGAQLIALRQVLPDSLGRGESEDEYVTNSGWYVARRGSDGRFAHPRPATTFIDGGPVWTPTPGVIAFGVSVGDDYFGHGAGAYEVPFGRAPRRRATWSIVSASSYNGRLRLSGFCRGTCRVNATTRALGHTSVSKTLRFEPFVGGDLETTFPARARRLQVTIRARDVRGRTTRLVASLRPGPTLGSIRDWRVTVR